MTVRTYTHLLCPTCGHRGTIKVSENDQPYSEPWETTEYIDRDMHAESPGAESTFAAQGDVCPKCGNG